MSSKSRRTSGASNTYSSNRKRQMRDLSPSSHGDQEDKQPEIQESDRQTDNNKKTELESKTKTSSKQAKDDAGSAHDDNEKDESEEEKEYEVETIKDHRHRGKVIEFLVGWKGYSSEDDSWEPARHLTGALELLKKYKMEHNLDQKQKNGRASNVSAKSISKKTGKKKEANGGSDEEGAQTSRKRKRLSEDKTKSSIDPLRKNGVGPTKADRLSDAKRERAETSEDEDRESSVDEDEWHQLHKDIASWDPLVRSVRTIEKPNMDEGENSPSSAKQIINVCLLWKTGRTTWVSNQTAREKLPQNLLDFYEAHLQFSSGEQEPIDD